MAASYGRAGWRADAVIHEDGSRQLGRADPHMVGLVLGETPSNMLIEPMKSARSGLRDIRRFGRRADLDDLAAIHHRDAGRQRHRLLLIVGDDDEGDAELYWMSGSSNWVCSRSFLSSAPSGSSSSSSFGRLASARASATRWRWPPES